MKYYAEPKVKVRKICKQLVEVGREEFPSELTEVKRLFKKFSLCAETLNSTLTDERKRL